MKNLENAVARLYELAVLKKTVNLRSRREGSYFYLVALLERPATAGMFKIVVGDNDLGHLNRAQIFGDPFYFIQDDFIRTGVDDRNDIRAPVPVAKDHVWDASVILVGLSQRNNFHGSVAPLTLASRVISDKMLSMLCAKDTVTTAGY